MPRALKAKLVLGPAATAADAPITRVRAAAARAAVAPTSTRRRSRVIACMDCLLVLGGSFIVGTPRSLDAVRDSVSRPSGCSSAAGPMEREPNRVSPAYRQ